MTFTRSSPDATSRVEANGSDDAAEWARLRRTNCFAFNQNESGQSLTSDMSSGTRMDVVELVIYGALAVWGPPLLFTAYLLSPIRSAASRSRQ